MNIRSLALLCLLPLPVWITPAHAAQSYDNCTGFITSLPAVISGQGTWCMKQDLATAITTGAAITINTNNVTIDCNDYKLGGLAAGVGTQAKGLYANAQTNLTARHCNIRGFEFGVQFVGSGSGHLIEDNRFDGNTHTGIYVSGDGSMIRHNRISDTGGSTVVPSAVAIDTSGDVDIVENTVSGLAATSGSNQNAYGIYVSNSSNGRISGNDVGGLVHDGISGVIYGIISNSTGHIILRGNNVSGDGSTGSYGLSCNDSLGTAKDNVTTGFATAIQLCSDAGGNYDNP
jgi:parallel beta-helix repeat protein